VIEDETLSAADQATERLLMGLRLAEGVPGAALAAAGVRPQRLSELAAAGLVMVSAERVAATAAGRQLLDGVIRELLRDAIPPEG
jgi:oxygen-independent coproporphyrinogen-3 oxidase